MLKIGNRKGLLPLFPDWAESFLGRDEDFFSDFALFTKTTPAVNIIETPEAFNLELSVPGMMREDFKVEVDNGILTIKADKEDKTEEKDFRFARREFSYFKFKRTFMLPENIRSDDIKAIYENGLLKLILPKKEVKKEYVKEIKIDG
jgi:HSP20 family protein